MPTESQSPHLPFGDNSHSPWYGQDILSVKQFDRADLEYIFGVAHEMRGMVERVGTFDLLKGKILANLFYEPSTRTASSFMAAMQRLGGSVIPINEVKYSSVSKGESLADTVRSLECYSDVIVLRHPEMGSAKIAAEAASKPILNAGDGVGEHPTQALLDLFTIFSELGEGEIDGMTVTMLGDLKYGRTVHSLARLLTLYDIKLNYVSPDILKMPKEVLEDVAAKGIPQAEYASLEEILPATDVLYVTRIQKERFEAPADYEKVAGEFIIDPKMMQLAKEQMIIMHPLPRVNEITTEIDADPRAAYFRQMEYGLYVRMALLAMVLGKA
ncbi:MAG: aspartate carbamoyltransferase [Anaerolineae bacterium]|jgi:aspartate carbamoyltransferase catalytic subunit|nr:aspartate carbamoyltransferase [Anaerolineae bacterium]MBT7074997.1 aspartate carbamoyltransferase [Anaerolineae bacterium]MBT7781633.1 aspartate carbamoyltransferase [Anaerolineae bacterium]